MAFILLVGEFNLKFRACLSLSLPLSVFLCHVLSACFLGPHKETITLTATP